MSAVVVHAMDTAWASSAPALSVVADSNVTAAPGAASNRLAAASGAAGATATYTPTAPVDLSDYDELRFWIRADRAADGSVAAPFYLELGYVDASAPATEHRWYVPVNRARGWEQRRIGFRPQNTRAAVSRIFFRVLDPLPFACHVDELLAVREEMLADVEAALLATLAPALALPGTSAVTMLAPLPVAGATTVKIAHAPAFSVGNRVRLDGGSAGAEEHEVTQVTHSGTSATELHFATADTVIGVFTAPGTVSLVVPVIVETPPALTSAPSPAVIVNLLDAREDLERTGDELQRDSFRPHDTLPLTLCSVRPSARAYVVDYQIAVVAPRRDQQLALHGLLLQRLSIDTPLRVNGARAPVAMLAPYAPSDRSFGQRAPIVLRIGTRAETAPRREQPAVRRVRVDAAPFDAPLDTDGLVVDL